MQRVGSASGARPGTSSGRPGTSSGRVVGGVMVAPASASVTSGFIVRVRGAAGVVRVGLASADETLVALRQAIADQCLIPIERQHLTRTRRPWFVAAAGDDGERIVDDFPRGEETLREAGLQHGDMLFVEQLPAPAAQDEPLADDDAPALAIDRTPSELVRGESDGGNNGDGSQILAFQGLDLTDESDQRSRASQRTALQLLATMRQEVVSNLRTALPSGDSGLSLEHLEQLQRLIEQCTPAADYWAATSSSHPPSSLTEGAHVSDSTAASPSDDLAEDTHRSARSSASTAAGSSAAAAATDSAAASDAAAAAAAAAASELQSEVEYWRGRYERLRVKAEKMNAAGMSLKNRFDTAALAHEQAVLQLRARLRRRDERIATLERTVAAWEQADRDRGGDGHVHVEALPSPLTTLGHAPTLRAADECKDPQDAGAQPLSSARRARPESASRHRRLASPALKSSQPPPDQPPRPTSQSRPSADPLAQRPSSSSGRSRLAAASLAASTVGGEAYADPEAEARAYKAARAAEQLAAEREAAHQAIMASKIQGHQAARAHMASANSRGGPVLARPRSGTAAAPPSAL